MTALSRKEEAIEFLVSLYHFIYTWQCTEQGAQSNYTHNLKRLADIMQFSPDVTNDIVGRQENTAFDNACDGWRSWKFKASQTLSLENSIAWMPLSRYKTEVRSNQSVS